MSHSDLTETQGIDVERARRETPGCANVLHFNNAGAALMPERVLDAVVDHLRLEAEIGGYEAANARTDELERIYDSAAALIGCRRDEIALVEHATRAWDQAFYAVPLGPGDRILTTMAEYAANYVAYLQVADRTGAVIDVAPNDPTGQVSVEALAGMLDDRVKLITVTHVPTNGGLVNPAEEIGRLARASGALYLLDACQSVGQMPIDVDRIGCDMLSATGRKFLRGPRGTGFLYVRRSALDRLRPAMIDHHGAEWVARDRYRLRPDARRFENWEASHACRLGLGVAIDTAMAWGIDRTWERILHLAGRLRSGLDAIPGVRTRDLGDRPCGIVTFSVEGHAPAEIKRHLADRRINVTVTDVASARLDMEARGLDELVRASVHYYNTEEEVERFRHEIEALA